jgi:hypothetical protein
MFIHLPQNLDAGSVVFARAAKEEPAPIRPSACAVVRVNLQQAAAASYRLAHRLTPFRISDVSMRHSPHSFTAGSFPSRQSFDTVLTWLFFGSVPSGRLYFHMQ